MKRICAVLLFVCLLLTACTADRTAEREFFAMDTLMRVKVWGSDESADAVQQAWGATIVDGKLTPALGN